MRDHPNMLMSEIAEQLGRSEKAISVRRCQLGIRRTEDGRRLLIKQRAELAARAKRAKGPEPDPSELRPPMDPPADPMFTPPVDLTPLKDLAIINIKGHEDLYERLCERAKREFRTPELQALYFIHRALEANP